jgi:hypothetical protein
MRFKSSRIKGFVKPIGSLALSVFEDAFLNFCLENVNVNSPNGSKYDLSLLKYLCNVLENAYDKNDKDIATHKVNKKDIVIKTYTAIKNRACIAIVEADKEILGSMIEELHNSKQIKRTSTFKYLFHLLKKRLLK